MYTYARKQEKNDIKKHARKKISPMHVNSNKPALAYVQENRIHSVQGQEKHSTQRIYRPTESVALLCNADLNRNTPLKKMEKKMENSQSMHPLSAADNISLHDNNALIQRKIAKAGVELQCGGITIKDKFGESLGKGHKICTVGKNNSHIEVDTKQVEYVSDVFSDMSDLFEDIEYGREQLVYMINLAFGSCQCIQNPGDTPSTANSPAIYKLGTHEYQLEKNPMAKWLAMPQMTVQIAKGTLKDFMSSVFKEYVKYKKTSSEEIQKRYIYNRTVNGSNLFLFNKIKEGFTVIDGNSAESDSAKALAKLAWQMIVCAVYRDFAPYYKARFPIMPRTSLKATFFGMSMNEQSAFIDIVNSLRPLLDGQKIDNWTYDNYSNSHLRNRNIRETINAITALESIYMSERDFSIQEDQGKNLTKKTVNGRTISVDALSSDAMASKGPVGQSVGAYSLPEDADSIIEIRSGMPVVQVNNSRNVINTYITTLLHYDGMYLDDCTNSGNAP